MEDGAQDWLIRNLQQLQTVYEAGNLGAFRDALYYCVKYEYPLPNWVAKAAFQHFDALIKKDSFEIKRHAKWLREYRQDMSDYEYWSAIEEARENGLTLEGAYEAAEVIKKDDIDNIKPDTAHNVRNRTNRRMRENPKRYFQLKTIKQSENKAGISLKSVHYLKKLKKIYSRNNN